LKAPKFRKTSVVIHGVQMRYADSGKGTPLVHFPAADAPAPTRAHELLARHFRVMVFEPPDAARSTDPAPELVKAIAELKRVNLLGSGAGSGAALALALALPACVQALVLEAPTALGPGDRDRALDARLATLETPTLVLCGTADVVVPPASVRAYKERLPNSHLVFVYGAGHAIGADRPEAFADVVVDFLERREAFVIRRTETMIHP
jgi:pimeloyl-ACP methyl ester carboxylesterase